MAKQTFISINEIQVDPTIEAMHKAIRDEADARPDYVQPDGTRNIGASLIGHECSRKIWYYHKGYPRKGKAHHKGVYAVEDGYYVEDKLAERLRKVPGVELATKDKDGKQLGFKDFGGRFKGYIDGIIKGILQAPKVLHIWECKAIKQEKFDKLNKLKEEHGEKAALQQWDFIYYVQAQLYMHYFKIKRHYLTCASPGGRDVTSVRTDYNKEFAESIVMKAERILNAKTPPQRASSNPKAYVCTFCEFKGECFSENT